MDESALAKTLIFRSFVPSWRAAFNDQSYIATARDFLEAHKLIESNPDIAQDLDEVARRAANYTRSTYWREIGCPFWGFARNIQRYISHVKAARPALMCSDCRTVAVERDGDLCQACATRSQAAAKEAIAEVLKQTAANN